MGSDTADTPPPVDPYDTDSDSRDDSRSDSISPSSTSTGINALIGGGVGVLLSFFPGSTLIGGGVAGYLEGGDPSDGLRVGALAGLVMLLPRLILGLLALGVLGFLDAGVLSGLVVLALTGVAIYTVGASVLAAVVAIAVWNDL